MKKNLLLMVGILIFTFYACSDDNVEYNDTTNDSSIKRNNNPEPIFTEINGHGGAFGAGVELAEYIPREVGCVVPGKCYAIPMFGGSGVNVSVELIRRDKIRMTFLSEYPQIRPRELEALGIESHDFEALADHFNTHYSILDFSPIEREVNQAFIRKYNLNKETNIYVFPGDYKISSDGRVKYVDISIHIQNGELDVTSYPTPPLPWCSLGCPFEGWRPIPVPAPAGYVLVPYCSCQ